MPLASLDNLVRIGKLKSEAPAQDELDGLLQSARARLTDAGRKDLALESRFDLAYNASHAIALAALRWHGYRSENRYLVFQALEHTLRWKPSLWKVMSAAHVRRNNAEYEGVIELDEQIVSDLIKVAETAYAAASALGPVK